MSVIYFMEGAIRVLGGHLPMNEKSILLNKIRKKRGFHDWERLFDYLCNEQQ